jgi:tRNA A58 N-methylase Trm61
MEQQSNLSHHVLPNKNGGWDIKKTNAKRASKHFDTKKEAVDAAKLICENEGTELVIHDKTPTDKVTVKPTVVEKKVEVIREKPSSLSALDIALIVVVLLAVGMFIYLWNLGAFSTEII